MSNIELVTEDDLDKIANCMTASFIADPTARFANPDAKEFLAYFGDCSRIFFEAAIKHGTAWRINGYAGAAAWFPPGEMLDFDALNAYVEKTCYPPHLEDLGAALGRFEEFHPHEPHWYLGMIGVDPFYQGQGLGFKLIDHTLKQVDDQGLLAYLESSNPKNIRLYERAGFEVLDKLYLAGEPTLTPHATFKKDIEETQ